MPSINKVVMMGHLVRESELKQSNSGKSMYKSTIAVQVDKRDTTFIDFLCFGGWADNIANVQSKGMLLLIAGKLKIEKWNTKDGQPRQQPVIVCSEVLKVRDKDGYQQAPPVTESEHRYQAQDKPPL